MSDVNSIITQSLEIKARKEIPSIVYKRKPYALYKKCNKYQSCYNLSILVKKKKKSESQTVLS